MRFLVADDHAVVRRGLHEIIAMRGGWTVGAEAADARDVLLTLRRERFDAVILDVSLGDRSGIEVLADVRREFPALPVLMLSIHDERQYAIRCLRAGASGYLQKNTSPETLIAALERILAGHTFVSEDVAEEMAKDLVRGGDRPPHERLSGREFEVFKLIATGKTATQIALALGLSVKTVSTYRARILLKTGFRSNADIVVYAVRNAIV